MATEWFVKRNDKKLGPFSNKDLRRLAVAGKLAAEDLVWKEGLSDWVSASRIESLFDTQSELSAATATPAEESAAPPEPAADQEDSEWSSDPEMGDEEEYPPLPPLPKRSRPDEELPTSSKSSSPSLRSHFSGDSTDRLCWWLKFYATVNFILSVMISAPLLLFGLISILISLVGIMSSATAKDPGVPLAGGLFFGVGLMSSLFYILCAMLWFMLLNVFTLACCWGAEVLQLLKADR